MPTQMLRFPTIALIILAGYGAAGFARRHSTGTAAWLRPNTPRPLWTHDALGEEIALVRPPLARPAEWPTAVGLLRLLERSSRRAYAAEIK